MSRINYIYLYPDKESAASDKEVADYIGITVATFRDRLKNLGPDHYLTYFPGPIPSKVRRFACDRNKSLLKTIVRDGRLTVDSNIAKLVIFKLIKMSQKSWKENRCEDSRSFLLNENGMLEWYMEAYPKIDHIAFIERMRKWVSEN